MEAGAKKTKKENMLKHPKFIKNKELSISPGLKRKGEGEQVKHGAEVVRNYNCKRVLLKRNCELGKRNS